MKKLFLNSLALLVPVLFFVLLEGGLRLFGFGEDYPLFIQVPAEADYLYQNPEVARRYFKSQDNVPGSQRDYFKAQKDSVTFRIFVQGGSSAAGYPLYYGGSFSRMLEQRLLQTFPGKNIEVINTAMAAVNSYTLRDLVDEIIEQDPDLILIYAGHNEYYGSLGVGSAESLGQFVGVVNLYLKLQDFRVVQALQRMLMKGAELVVARESPAAAGTTLMSRLVEEQEIPLHSPLYDMGIAQFEKNMGAILKAYQEAEIPVLISTLASNEKDQAPFISKPSDSNKNEALEEGIKNAVASLVRGDTLNALEHIEQAIAVDSIAAAAFYAKGQLLYESGQFSEAREAFTMAKDRDQLRFRAPEEINDVIRELAVNYDAVVVDAQQALRDKNGHGIIGSELMLEHLHPNVEGYFAIADAFYQSLNENGFIGEWNYIIPAEHARNEVLLTRVDSLVGQYRVRQLMNSWPFKPYGTVGEAVEVVPESEEERIAFALYRSELGWYKAMGELRNYYEANGQFHEALRTSLAVIQEFPFVADPYLATAQILIRQGRSEEALNYIEAGNEREESAIGLAMKGSVLLAQKKPYDALEALEKSISMDASNQQALFALSGAYIMAGRSQDAMETIDKILTLNPNHPQALQVKAQLEVNR
ncbi:MAG: tetratricopeptide repeat protein [Rhodothermaceae bacterium]|nr:tetratricopeptide repeat protein [Rhodothermaceae bacterium]